MLFCHRSGLPATDTQAHIVSAYDKGIISYSAVKRRFERFAAEDYDLDDKTRSGRPPLMDLDDLRTIVEAEPYSTTRELHSKLGMSQRTEVGVLKKHDEMQKLGRWIPHALSQFDLDRRVDACPNF